MEKYVYSLLETTYQAAVKDKLDEIRRDDKNRNYLLRRYLEKKQYGKNDKVQAQIRQKVVTEINIIIDEKENVINKHFANTLSCHELDDSFSFPNGNISRITNVLNQHDDSFKDGASNWATKSVSSQNDSSFHFKRKSSIGKEIPPNTQIQISDKENSYSYKYMAKKKKNNDMPLKSGMNSVSESSNFSKFLMNEI